jgi:transcriptional regulator with XRE-family HTH domain
VNPVDFGIYLKKLRQFKGITLEKLGEIVGLSKPYLSNIENGRRGIPSPDLLNRLAEPLGITHSELMVKAGHISGQLLDHDSLEFKASKIGAAIVDVLKEILAENKQIKNEVAEFHRLLVALLNGADIQVSELKRLLYDVEPDNELVPRLGNEVQTVKIDDLLALLDKVISDDTALRMLKSEYLEKNDLRNYLDQKHVEYNGHKLTDQDRQRILDMLKALFPQYEMKGE